MSKAINLLEAWCNKGANREKSLVRDFFSNYTLDSSYEFAEKILLLMKYAVLIFKAEKKVINRMELQTKRRDTQGYRQSESDLLTDVQRFKSDWYENAYTTSKRNLESLKGHNPPLTATDIQEIRTRWRDSEFPIPYGTERIQFRRRLHL
jgi:flagellar biosynthesis/type III secretory pathway M-ring protein FliF/YscJ